MSNRPFVCFAGEDWWYHNHAHADFQLALQLARTRPTLVINSIGMRMPTQSSTTQPVARIMRKLRSTARLLKRPRPDRPQFWVLSAISLPVFGKPRLEKLNARSIALQVKLAMKIARMGSNPDVLITVPTAYSVLQHLHPAGVGYLRADDHGADPEVDAQLIRGYEDALFASVDQVFYASEALMKSDGERNKGKGQVLDHGVDLELFQVKPGLVEPADLAAIPHPRLGCFGTIEHQGTDIELLRTVATSLPDAHLVLIGRSAVDLKSLMELPNVHYLGYKEHAQIPSYGQGFDVALLPRPMDQWNSHSNPIKIKEYLALGLTIVATEFPESLKLNDLVRIGSNYESFVEECRNALVNPIDPAIAIGSVQQSSWAARSDQLTRALVKPLKLSSGNSSA
jgi:glycosyltransferase involved in cell wall biosynthesis